MRKVQRNSGIVNGGLATKGRCGSVRLDLHSQDTSSGSSCQAWGSDDIKGHCWGSREEMIMLFRDQFLSLFKSQLVTAESAGLK